MTIKYYQNTMTKQKDYQSPAVLNKMDIHLERSILTASVIDSISSIETGGQSVGSVYEGSSSGTFNHNWE